MPTDRIERVVDDPSVFLLSFCFAVANNPSYPLIIIGRLP
jgi:hypothetical protein